MKRDVAIAAIVVAIALTQNLSRVDSTPFHPDETRWLNRGRYIEDVLSPVGMTWSDYFLTRGQPPGGSYLMGIGLLVQGRPLEPNKIWQFAYGDLWNIRNGNMPSNADLDAGRRTNAVIAALAVAAIYFAGRRLTNRVGGAVAALALAYHPLMNEVGSMALADSLLVLSLALTVLAACRLADLPTWPRALLLAGVLGLGGLTKLSPMLLTLPLAALGVLLLIRSRRARRLPNSGPLSDPARLGWRLVTLPVLVFTLFVVAYPYLWPDPAGRTWHLFAFRTREMAHQARTWPHVAIEGRWDALEHIWRMLGENYSVTSRLATISPALESLPPQLDISIALFGGGALLGWVVRRGLSGGHALAALIVFGQAALIAGGLRVDYARYYVPLVFVIALGIGTAAGTITLLVSELTHRARRSIASPAAAT